MKPEVRREREETVTRGEIFLEMKKRVDSNVMTLYNDQVTLESFVPFMAVQKVTIVIVRYCYRGSFSDFSMVNE